MSGNKKILNKQPNHLVELEKEKQTKHRVKEGKKSYISEQK